MRRPTQKMRSDFMKIKVIDTTYGELLKEKQALHERHGGHIKPKRPNLFFRTLMRVVAAPDLIATKFKFEKAGMEKLDKRESVIFLMNHSSFIDLEIVARMLYPRPFNIVTTTDGFIGKNWLMRQIGCFPTKKFVQDPTLIKDMHHVIDNLHSSVVLFPEAGYSFDGTSTVLPESLGRCVKHFGVPVIMITTYGAFSRDPLYNNLQRRKVEVRATEEYLLSPEEIEQMSEEEINGVLKKAFSFDSFRWQQREHVKIDEDFRADYLNRVLYKCPVCKKEGEMEGKGTALTCKACGKKYNLDEYGYLVAEDGNTHFPHVPDWYNWQREEVRRELEDGRYMIDIPVEIFATIDTKRLFRIGEGRLSHTKDGFVLEGCEGELHYKQRPLASYTLNSDYNWYEIGDMLSIGNSDVQYYCFPKTKGDIVTKARLATEELYKIVRRAVLERRAGATS